MATTHHPNAPKASSEGALEPDADAAATASRRTLLAGAAGLVATAALPRAEALAASMPSAPQRTPQAHSGAATMNTITTKDGTQIYFKDWGTGQPIVFSHGWPLSSDAWEDQMFFLARNGYRVIGVDRRGHGRSSQPWQGNDLDTYADDLATLVQALDLRDAVHVGHSTGGGEVARYIGRYGTSRVAKAALVSATPPFMPKSAANPEGTPVEVFDGIRASVIADRAQFYRDLSLPFFGYNRPGAKISEGVRDQFVQQCLMTGFPASYLGTFNWSETDLTEDLKKIDVPVLVVHGDDDQIVPVKGSAILSARIIRKATLKVYEGAPHGLPTTHKERLNQDLLAFIRASV